MHHPLDVLNIASIPIINKYIEREDSVEKA